MAKSQRSKREKRLRTIRREISTPFYDNKEAAKLAAQEAALSAPKVQQHPLTNKSSMEITPAITASDAKTTMDLDMVEGGSSKSLKPIGRRLKKKLKIGKGKFGKGKRNFKGKIRQKL